MKKFFEQQNGGTMECNDNQFRSLSENSILTEIINGGHAHDIADKNGEETNIQNNVEKETTVLPCTDYTQKEVELLRKEIELLNREKQLLEKENSISKVKPVSESLSKHNLIDMINNFSREEENFIVRQEQINNVKKIYKITDEEMKVIVIGKLKNKALRWFHSSAQHIEMSLNELMSNLKSIFDTQIDKSQLRKALESRI